MKNLISIVLKMNMVACILAPWVYLVIRLLDRINHPHDVYIFMVLFLGMAISTFMVFGDD